MANYIRVYGDPGFKLGILGQIRDLLTQEVCTIPPKQPIIGEVFATQAGIHQTGISRQGEAGGGPIYLPFDAGLVGEEVVELNRIGALSGMDGIVSVLNQQVKVETGEEGTFTNVSRAVKYVYDRIQEAYDGTYDSEQGFCGRAEAQLLHAGRGTGSGQGSPGRSACVQPRITGVSLSHPLWARRHRYDERARWM